MARIDDLIAAREVMWASVLEAPADKRGPLMAQWRAIEKDIAELTHESEAEVDPIDEIAARRAARGGATARLGQASRRPS